jgi:hypothetical protein
MSAIPNHSTSTSSVPNPATELPNGAAMAAFLAAGLGAFAVGFLVLLNEMDVFSAPTLYAPAGGVSGRTTFAVVAWLAAWIVLHARWKRREVSARRVWLAIAVLTALGILGTFPPVWGLVS